MANKMKKETEELMQILEEAAEAERLARQKEEEKVWNRTIPASRSLTDFLLKLTKDEMQEIAGALSLTKFKSLKKQELADFLKEPILRAAEMLFGVLDAAQYEFFHDLCQRQGLSPEMVTASSSLPYFLDVGLIFPGTVKKERVLAMPAEIIDLFQKIDTAEYKEKAARNTKWIQLTGGVLFYYGVQTLEQLADQVNKLTGEEVNAAELAEVLHFNGVFTAGTMKVENGVFCNSRVFDYEKVQAEQTMRTNIWFYPISSEQALTAGRPDYVERTAEFGDFSKYLQEKYKADAVEADNIAAECAFAFRMGENVENVLEYVAGMIDIKGAKGLKELTNQAMGLANTTRQWGLKGYAPCEVRTAHNNISNVLMPEAPADIDNLDFSGKIGRNEPCPCGSGRKYKKCCGKAL